MREGFVTPGDWVRWRFGGDPWGRALGIAVGVLMAIALGNFLVAQLVAMGHVTREVTGGIVPYEVGVIVLAGMILFYETLGGMRAVAWTDAAQGVLMLAGLTTLLLWLLGEAGGLAETTREIAALRPEIVRVPDSAERANWFSSVVLLGLASVVYPQAIQRIYAAKSGGSLKRALALMSFMPLTTTLVVTMIGWAAIPRLQGLGGVEADAVMPRLLGEWAAAGPGAAALAILVFLGALAAIMSTADSVLLSLGSVVAGDLMERPSQDEATTGTGKRAAAILPGGRGGNRPGSVGHPVAAHRAEDGAADPVRACLPAGHPLAAAGCPGMSHRAAGGHGDRRRGRAGRAQADPRPPRGRDRPGRQPARDGGARPLRCGPEEPMSVRRALVLSGGGARGAYEAGVLRFVLGELPARLTKPPVFDLVCGTSVGAIHACYLGATATQGPERVDRLADIWQRMHLHEIFHLTSREALRIPRRLFGLIRKSGELPPGRLPPRLYGLLDTGPLERIVLDSIPWRSIRRNVRSGALEGLCVTATQIATGRAIVFTEHRDANRIPWTVDPSVVLRPTRLGPHHALASAAIPLLFPAVRVDGTYYADGGLRLNTPLAPALRLGADRVLVIGLRHGHASPEEADLAERRVSAYGNPIYLFGKVLNALLLDHVQTDLAQMRIVNDMLEAGTDAYGPDFVERLNESMAKRSAGPLRVVDELLIQPSSDIGRIAAQILDRQREQGRLSTVLRVLLGTLGVGEQPLEADLLSYLLFEEEYTAALLTLGYADARAQEAALVEFFEDEAG